jgi:type VI secretion system Hcp family effector
MRVSRTYVLVVCLVVLAVPVFAATATKPPANGATITIDGFQPEAATAYSFGVVAPTDITGGGGAGTGKVTFSDFTFTKTLDTASPKLFLSCVKGEHIKNATIVMRDDKGNDLTKIMLTDVLIKSVQTSSDGTNVTEAISLTYSKIEFVF